MPVQNQKKIVKREESMTISEAGKIVGVGEQYFGDLPHVYAEYFAKYEVHKENEELTEKEEELKEAKNVLTHHFLFGQIDETGSFKVPSDLPFKHICKWCNGTGERFLFNRRMKEVPCNRCEDGKNWIRCRTCKGTGRYVTTFDDGGKNDVACTKCKDDPKNHKGQEHVVCRVCKGTKIAKIPVLDSSLESVTPCQVCDQLGFIIPKESKSNPDKSSPSNPVLAGDLAQKLKKQIDESEPFDKS